MSDKFDAGGANTPLETVAIVDESGPEGFVCINARDYDADKHALYDPEKKKKGGRRAATAPAGDAEPPAPAEA